MLHGRAENQELAGEHAERRHAQYREAAQHEPPAYGGVGHHQPADLIHDLRAALLGGVPHREEDRRLGQAVHGHVQQACERRDRPAHAEREGHESHVLDG
ncbi:hypothetical protein D3C83_82550 [compost metagenome]